LPVTTPSREWQVRPVFFSSLLLPCSFESVLATAYFFGQCGHMPPFLFTNQPRNSIIVHYCNHVGIVPQPCTANSSHSSCPTHEMHNITLKTTTNQSVSWIAVVFLSFHNHHLVPRTEDKHCVGIICRGGMALIIRLSLLGLCNRVCASYKHPAMCSFEAISSSPPSPDPTLDPHQ